METEEIQNSTPDTVLQSAPIGGEENFGREGIAPTTSAPGRPTQFTKVEKSLASLGFFTPSSRRIKNQKVKRVGFTRENRRFTRTISGLRLGWPRRNSSPALCPCAICPTRERFCDRGPRRLELSISGTARPSRSMSILRRETRT